jgi:aryl-alcohol dehydrogenase-like predicted oxidoreductase
VGVSNETAFGLMEFCRFASANSALPRIITIQNSYNLLCRTFNSALAECCHHQQVSLLAYSPLAMGLLSGKYLSADGGSKDARLNLYKGRYAEAECRYDFSKPNLMPAVSAYVDIARKYGISPVALAIGFVLQHSLLMSVVIGATKVSQLKEILQAYDVTITDEIRSEIDAVYQRYPNPAP